MPVRMDDLSSEYREARKLVQLAEERDLRRGFTTTLIVLVAPSGSLAFVWLVYLANRISRPMQQLTAGLGELAAGRLETGFPQKATTKSAVRSPRSTAAPQNFSRAASGLSISRRSQAGRHWRARWRTS